jgi:hypothetical protein
MTLSRSSTPISDQSHSIVVDDGVALKHHDRELRHEVRRQSANKTERIEVLLIGDKATLILSQQAASLIFQVFGTRRI